jgi:hypothetical protein
VKVDDRAGIFGCVALFLLSFPVALRRVDALDGQCDAAFGGAGLGVQGGQAAGVGALEGTVDAGSAVVEVEVLPVEAEEFAFAEAGAEGEFVQGVQSVAAGRLEELSGLGRR